MAIGPEQKALSVFLDSPDGQKYAKQVEDELAKTTYTSHERTLTYLKALKKQKVLIEEKKGRQIFYKLNKNNSSLPLLMAINESRRSSKFLGKSEITVLLHEVVEKAREEAGFNLLFVVLFGSHARSDARDGSDVDLLFVTNKSGAVKRKIEAIVNEKSALHTEKVSAHVVNVEELFKKWGIENLYASLFRDRITLFGYENFWRFVLEKGEP